MTFDSSDPIWTAYLTGELTDDERADVEAQLAESPEARELVVGLRRTILALASELAAEPTPNALAMTAEIGTEAAKPQRRSRKLAWAISVALCLLIAVGLLLPGIQWAREASRRPDNNMEGSQRADSASSKGIALPVPNLQAKNGQREIGYTVGEPTTSTKPRAGIDNAELPNVNDGLSLGGAGGKLPSEYALEHLAKGNYSANVGTSGSEADLAVPELHAPEMSVGRIHFGVAVADEPDMRQGTDGGSGTFTINGGTYNQTGGTLPNGNVSVGGWLNTGRDGGSGTTHIAGPLSYGGGAALTTSAGTTNLNSDADGNLTANANGTIGGPGTLNASDRLHAQGVAANNFHAANNRVAPGYLGQAGSGTVQLGRETQSLTMMVTPRIVVQEEEEQRLGGRPAPGTEAYDAVTDNPFRAVAQEPLSTFSIDVDTASLANVRRFITQNHRLPPPAAVRIEELVNYFHYDYPQPAGEAPFSVHAEVAGCPWNAQHRLLKIGLKGREIPRENRPASNLVFLVDVSGSMNEPNKLPLVKDALKLLVGQLTENDRVAMVVYAGTSGLVLPSTNGSKPAEIRAAIDRLEAGGSTNGGAGIQLAYETALQNLIPHGNNRVILATDGDFNVGITNRDELVKFVAAQAASGVYLTALGFGFGNLKDNMLEQLADKGNGNYAYIDDLREAHKVLVEEMSGTLVTIAKDVKIQLEFNPAAVAAFRLVGYENRILAHKDFNDDKKDAGEIGAGHTVTALYEIVPATADGGAGADEPRTGQAAPAVDPLRYQRTVALTEAAGSGELLTVNLRYKDPEASASKKLSYAVKDAGLPYGQASGDFKFASSVALFGMVLRNSPYRGSGTLAGVVELAEDGRGSDHDGRRAEFISLVRKAIELAK